MADNNVNHPVTVDELLAGYVARMERYWAEQSACMSGLTEPLVARPGSANPKARRPMIPGKISTLPKRAVPIRSDIPAGGATVLNFRS